MGYMKIRIKRVLISMHISLHFTSLKLRVLESANGVETSVLLKKHWWKNMTFGYCFSPCGARLAIGCK
jgi:hypothetical protein